MTRLVMKGPTTGNRFLISPSQNTLRISLPLPVGVMRWTRQPPSLLRTRSVVRAQMAVPSRAGVLGRPKLWGG